MRTLKKTLALVLVLVMVAGFGVISASADFTDVQATDDHYEAIQVLSGLGIINGTSTEANTFEPDETLTREQAAKIVSYVVLGNNAVYVADAPDSALFDDVAADRWSAGYIAYCKNKNIIAGYGDGTFDPTGKLTSAAFAKMLLVAIGFDAEENGLVGGNWVLNTAICAQNAGLYDDSIGISNKPITRAQACELALAALQYSASGKTTVYVVYDANSEATLATYSDVVSAYAAMSILKETNPNAAVKIVETSADSLGANNYGLTSGTAKDEFGRKFTEWTNGKTGNQKKVYAEFAPEYVLKYTTGTTYGKIAAALGCTNPSDTVSLTVYNNTATGADAVSYSKNDTTAVGGTGTLVEVYKTGSKSYDVIVVDTYVAKLAKGDIHKATAATATDDAKDAYITITTADGKKEFKTEAFAADDVVLYTYADGNIVSVEKAPYITGTVTAKKSGEYIRVDNEKYYNSIHEELPKGYDDLGSSWTYYLDGSANLIFATIETPAEVETHYVYVLQTAALEAKKDGSNMFETVPGSAAAAQARIVDLETGEVKVVNQSIVKGADGEYYYADKNGSADKTRGVITGDGKPETVGKIMSYATPLSDGSIVLVGNAKTETVTLGNKSASIGITGKYANSSTALKIVEIDAKGNVSITNYTGYVNFPVYNGDAVVSANSSGLVSEILVVRSKEAPTESYTYAIYNGMGETTAEGTTHAFYVHGTEVGYIAAEGFEAPTKGDVVTLTVKDNKVTAANKVEAYKEVKVAAVEAGFFMAEDGTIYYFTDSCEVVNGEDGSLDTLEVDDTVTIYGEDSSKIAFIVVK